MCIIIGAGFSSVIQCQSEGVACDVLSQSTPSQTQYQIPFESNVSAFSIHRERSIDAARAQHRPTGVHSIPPAQRSTPTSSASLQSTALRASSSNTNCRWRLRVERRPRACEVADDVADVPVLCTIALSRWAWPDVAGLRGCRGTLRMCGLRGRQWADKAVGVAGAMRGSSASQIGPALQPRVRRVVNFCARLDHTGFSNGGSRLR
ncbi:hypothetical protein BC834DRAFT_840900 [Gloeopeniophorella convolvens]|nr:hypothetical protein BC834DRAFT_840900 [Gloeopeniophorella convolvens]